MQRYTNALNLPLSIAVFLALDHYDHNPDPYTISATALIKPLRQTILTARVPPAESVTDVSHLVASRIGTAIHDGIERAWSNGNHVQGLQALGYPQKLIDRIRINPTPDEVDENTIPIYLEQRLHRKLGKYTISGKFDFIQEARVQDFKSTGVFTWINNTKDEDNILQGSIYRWLDPEKITADDMSIIYLFTDWQAIRAKLDSGYPSSRAQERKLTLLSLAETERYISTQLDQLATYWDAEETTLPLCTDKELWRREPQFKYYKNPAKTSRSTKNFDNRNDAHIRLAQDGGIGKIVEVPGTVNACKYCPAFSVCSQKNDLIANGSLQL